MSFPKYYFKNKNELFFQQKLKVFANNMKKFVPLIILLCLIFYGIFSSYKKKMQRNPDLINQLKLKTFSIIALTQSIM